LPRYFPMDFALAGDSTITSDLLIASLHFRLLSVPAADLPVRPIASDATVPASGNLLCPRRRFTNAIASSLICEVAETFSTWRSLNEMPQARLRIAPRLLGRSYTTRCPMCPNFSGCRTPAASRAEHQTRAVPVSREICPEQVQVRQRRGNCSQTCATCAERNSCPEAAGCDCSTRAQTAR
jgi:hypothetical protein